MRLSWLQPPFLTWKQAAVIEGIRHVLLPQHHLDGDDALAYVLVYAEELSIQTYFEYVVLTSWTDHMALDQSRKSHDSKQNQNRSVLKDLTQIQKDRGNHDMETLTTSQHHNDEYLNERKDQSNFSLWYKHKWIHKLPQQDALGHKRALHWSSFYGGGVQN
ncbi:Cell division protein kinase 9 [Gryllus bimaculatus]|nr:Cell division protein kinase 9 [Gryllus bimaculatus]